jgi:hypothetical protein
MKSDENRFSGSYSVPLALINPGIKKTPMAEVFFIQAENIHKLFTFLM